MPDSKSYPAKNLYYKDVAQSYDKERFGNLKGKIYDYFEKYSITRALKNIPKGFLILDIPCGTGRITKHLYDLGYNVIGADISEDMLEIARNKVGAFFVKRDIENTQYETKSFHVAVCLRLMGHLPYEKKVTVLKELKRIAHYIVVTFYFKPKPNWYNITPGMVKPLLKTCGLKVISKHPIFPFWSDGITYLL